VDSLSCDVLVIGAGPAGCAAALAAADEGAGVVLIDRRREVGVPFQCAGFVPAAAAGLFPGLGPSLLQQVRTMLTYTPDGEVAESRSPGYNVRRDIFDQTLAGAARESGVRILTRTRAVRHEGRVTSAITPAGRLEIASAVTIGADGPRSIAGSWMQSVNRDFVAAMQWTVPLRRPLEENRVYFRRGLRGGYGWLFPGGGQANVGIGMERGVGENPGRELEYFVRDLARQGLIEPRRLMSTGGLIPAGGLLRLHRDDLILAGDAGGFCHPVTGAGIAAALQSGRQAGEAAAQSASQNGSNAPLADFAEEMETVWRQVLAEAVGRRRSMYSMKR